MAAPQLPAGGVARLRGEPTMRARVPITVGGLSVAVSLVLSAIVGSGGATRGHRQAGPEELSPLSSAESNGREAGR
jgi:hypothetical protein